MKTDSRSIMYTIAVFLLVSLCSYGQSNDFRIGTASRIINPEIGSWVQGAGVPKKAEKIRDNLEANGVYLSNGGVELLLVSCDLVGLEPEFNVRLREAMAVASGMPVRNILISSTHTHGGPS